MLGPSRFTHIETCAREACRDYKIKDELEDTVRMLHTLDGELTKQRAKLQALTDVSESSPNREGKGDDPTVEAQKRESVTTEKQKGDDATTVPQSTKTDDPIQLGKRKRSAADATDYTELIATKDTKKARRLVTARENAIKSVKALITKKEEEQKGGKGNVTTPSEANSTPAVDTS
jgi:hypothetical protein